MNRVPEEMVQSVSQITTDLRRRLERRYARVWVRGEVSSLKRASSGHLYFTLKDANAQLRAVMFRSHAMSVRFAPADGLQVLAEGTITCYEPRGELQIGVRRLLPSGAGALTQALEALRARLAAEGLFDPARRRPLPRFPRTVAVITSPTGAAVRDLLHVISRRWPPVSIVFLPVRVQGEGAAGEIAWALDRVSRWGGADLAIVGRGGGSLEDLWAFNEEIVVRAIARCGTPVVSAVGHETDVTLADLVADLRAPTPSAAAEIVVPDRRAVAQELALAHRRLSRRLRSRIAEHREGLRRLMRAYGFRRPERFLARPRQRVDDLAQRLEDAVTFRLDADRRRFDRVAWRLTAHDPGGRVRAERAGVGMLAERLHRAVGQVPGAGRMRLDGLRRALVALDPTAVLARGYCLARDPETGAVRTGAAGLEPGSGLLVQFRSDRVMTRVERVESGGPRELDVSEAT